MEFVLQNPYFLFPETLFSAKHCWVKHWFIWMLINFLGSLIVTEGEFFLMVCRDCSYLPLFFLEQKNDDFTM